jgi:DNA primase catalytic subunit
MTSRAISVRPYLTANPKLWQMLRKHELALDAIFDYYAHMFPEVRLRHTW